MFKSLLEEILENGKVTGRNPYMNQGYLATKSKELMNDDAAFQTQDTPERSIWEVPLPGFSPDRVSVFQRGAYARVVAKGKVDKELTFLVGFGALSWTMADGLLVLTATRTPSPSWQPVPKSEVE